MSEEENYGKKQKPTNLRALKAEAKPSEPSLKKQKVDVEE